MNEQMARIMIVDDNATILMLAKKILERSGIQVLTAKNGAEAIASFQSGSVTQLQLLVLDHGLPDMSGPEVCAAIQALQSGLHFIISSGSSQSELKPLYPEGPAVSFLQKPYKPDVLLTRVSSLLQV